MNLLPTTYLTLLGSALKRCLFVCSFLKCPVFVPLLWFGLSLSYLYIEGVVCRHWPSSIQQVYANSEVGVKVLVLPVSFDVTHPSSHNALSKVSDKVLWWDRRELMRDCVEVPHC